MHVRKLVALTEELGQEGPANALSPATVAVAAVVAGPWAGSPLANGDAPAGIAGDAEQLGALLAPILGSLLDGELEALGAAAVAGGDVEPRHGTALIRASQFQEHVARAAGAVPPLIAVELRAGIGEGFSIPLGGGTAQADPPARPSFEATLPDAPHRGEIVIALAASVRRR